MTGETQDDFADRVWLAYWSLPRTSHGRPESFHSLEKAYGIPNGTLGKIVKGDQKSVKNQVAIKLAQALRQTVGYLISGEGEPPIPTGKVPVRTDEHAASVEESGEATALKPSVSLEVQRIVDTAVDRAKHEAPADAQPHQVLALALMHVSAASSRK